MPNFGYAFAARIGSKDPQPWPYEQIIRISSAWVPMGLSFAPEWETPSCGVAHEIVMEDWTVILRRPDGRLEFEHVEADSFALEPDPLSKNSRNRYYVLRDPDRNEIARFNEKDVVGIRKGRRFDLTARPDWDW